MNPKRITIPFMGSKPGNGKREGRTMVDVYRLTDLNKTHPKDRYPLPTIDEKIEFLPLIQFHTISLKSP